MIVSRQILPCVFYIKLRGVGTHGVGYAELALNAAIILLACVGAVFGTVQARTRRHDSSFPRYRRYMTPHSSRWRPLNAMC